MFLDGAEKQKAAKSCFLIIYSLLNYSRNNRDMLYNIAFEYSQNQYKNITKWYVSYIML